MNKREREKTKKWKQNYENRKHHNFVFYFPYE